MNPSPRARSIFATIAALVVLIGVILILAQMDFPASRGEIQKESGALVSQSATVGASLEASGSTTAQSAVPEKKAPTPAPVAPASASSAQTQTKKPAANEVSRIQDPYPYPPLPLSDINVPARAALVNILCTPRGATTLSPITGSGVIIDPRGVILTSAHVAQYVLLSQSPNVNLACVIRSGSPAQAHWSAQVVYIPPVWVEKHAGDIRNERPEGTGEHDYALLRITGSLNGSPPPFAFPYLAPDTRDAIGFLGDPVLVTSYPAEFLSDAGTQAGLYPISSETKIGDLLTFVEKSVDLISLGGVITAQSGSSGGAVTNAWGRLIGLVSATSEGATTAERDLRAITLSYINRDLAAQSSVNLSTLLKGDIAAEALQFNTEMSAKLIALYIPYLK